MGRNCAQNLIPLQWSFMMLDTKMDQQVEVIRQSFAPSNFCVNQRFWCIPELHHVFQKLLQESKHKRCLFIFSFVECFLQKFGSLFGVPVVCNLDRSIPDMVLDMAVFHLSVLSFCKNFVPLSDRNESLFFFEQSPAEILFPLHLAFNQPFPKIAGAFIEIP